MFIDARTLPPNQRLQADICIVGAGPAGIALATALSEAGQQIILAESGGLEFDYTTQQLNAGEIVGLGYKLSQSRLRGFGGSGNHWGGNCRRLDTSDFIQRDWMPLSGWPFSRSELDPYYDKASLLCGVGERSVGPGDLCAGSIVPVPWTDPLETAVWQISPARPFGARFSSMLAGSSAVKTILYANLIALTTRNEGRGIAEARFGTLSGVQFTVSAQRYVLACGGIENARLLLAMKSKHHPAGLGNQHDLVGRFFTEHPEISVGVLVYSRLGPGRFAHLLESDRGRFAEGFRISDAFQRSARIGNVAFWPLFSTEIAAVPRLDTEFWILVQDTLSRLSNSSPSGPRLCTILTVTFEQSPNAESRITLADARDLFGMPRVQLDWRLNEFDKRTFATALKVIARESGVQRIGRFWLRPPFSNLDFDRIDSFRLDVPLTKPTTAHNRLDTELGWACHHMGTTRMHSDPHYGVVNPEGRVHGIQNLYIAGSSVFPSAGVSNPTLTIIGLALRLADHLKTLPE